MRRIVRITSAVLAAAVTFTGSSVGSGAAVYAAGPPLSAPAISVHFDLTQGQLPENIIAEAGGDVVVTFAASRQVARIDTAGRIRVLATLPAPSAAEGLSTPVLHFPLATGLARADSGILYALYAAGSPTLSGLWRIEPGRTPHRIAALPAASLPNGLALNAGGTKAYAADSALGVVYEIRLSDGAVRTWATGADLQADGFLGANGVKVHGRSVWVSNLDRGTLLRIPMRPDGSAGRTAVAATGLEGIDDFAFIGPGDTVLAALNQPNTVVLVAPGRAPSVVLSAVDGLQGPTAVAVHGRRIWVPSAAYNSQTDPNLLTARLELH
nr:hypothetical protein GCM10020063_039620 [Dactylosporangium thailandense]